MLTSKNNYVIIEINKNIIERVSKMYTYQLYWNIEELKEINEKLAEQITNVFDEKTLTENVLFKVN